MNRYQTPTPRTAFGLAAIALTVATVGVAVVMPAKMEPATPAPTRAAAAVAARAIPPAVTEVSIIPARVDVRGIRNHEVASARADGGRAKCASQG